MAEPRPSFLASPTRPKLKLPAGACDAPVHLFGPHVVFPSAEPRPSTAVWRLQVHVEASLLQELAPRLQRAAVPGVIGRVGRVDASLGLEQPAFGRLLALMRDPRFRVKVSGSERISRRAAPWEDAIPFARKLVAEFGDRCFWGSDWPHPNLAAVPDDGVLVDLLSEIAPSEKERKALL